MLTVERIYLTLQRECLTLVLLVYTVYSGTYPRLTSTVWLYFTGNQLRDDTRTIDTKSLLDSAIEKYKSIIIKSPSPVYRFNQNWRIEPEMRLYWTTSFLLPVGSILILAVVVLLMVLFKRCPHVIAAIVTAMFTIIIILITILSLNHDPVYT